MTICAEYDGRTWTSCTRGIEGCICGFDSIDRVAHVLAEHNRWRRGEEGAPQIHPAAIGQAIDEAVKWLRSESAKKWQDGGTP